MCEIRSIDEMLGEIAGRLDANTAHSPQPHSDTYKTTRQKDMPKPIIKQQPKSKSAQKGRMTLATARKTAEAVCTAAERLGIRVVAAVVNEGANLVCLEAMDDSYIASINVAKDKAYTAAALKMPTYKALAESRGGALDGLVSGNGIMLLGGGEPLEYDGLIYGGIGVSGGTKEQDALLAAAAAKIFAMIMAGNF